ncbi:MAG: UDP-N-acetylmuramate dehydrogenase [Spirochaetia bacterium]|nr:UDP-N-acetylmuramate dehydrogenase [Spirochaetia bacterium]
MKSLSKLFNKININGTMLFDEPLSGHSTFKTGGNADLLAVPQNISALEELLSVIKENDIPYFILGGGANILFSDSGFRGVVIDMAGFNSISFNDCIVKSGAGAEFSLAAEEACKKSLSGLEYFYGMTGSTGGSEYMYARCYGKSVSDVLYKVKYLDELGKICTYRAKQGDFGYKKSPFQNTKNIILEAEFILQHSGRDILLDKSAEFKKDREAKGHYSFPCAGSVFKNNREFGHPSGKIIDSLGLRGFSIGGALVSPLHANIIVNNGNATSEDIKKLIHFIEEKVFKTYGFRLEREIIYID